MSVKHLTVAFALCAMSSSAVLGADPSAAYSFLDIPSSSHVYGLGGINVSLIDPDDINVTDQNPALLGPEIEKQIGVNYMRYFGDSNFAGARYGMAVGEHSAFGASIQYVGYGDIQGADVEGNLTGSISAKDINIGLTYSRDINSRLRGGATLKTIYSAYDEYSAMALAVDLGLNYYNPDRDSSLSLVIANLGGQVKRFNNVYDRLPFDIRLGWTKGLGSSPFRISVTAWNLTRWKMPYVDPGDGSDSSEAVVKDGFMSTLFRHLVFGAEYAPGDKFYIGLGYNYKTRTDMAAYQRSFLSGFSACAGLNVKRFGIGVAFAQPHTGATTFMFNLTMRLSEL
ncbi:MAG: type IX secretion system protein PorQ [Muribaculum sp.]|nr:type IX secretion system protein PorQ [Muribaculum sp.]